MGLIFPTKYKLEEKNIVNLERSHISQEIIQQLSPIIGKAFPTKESFLTNLEKELGDKLDASQKTIITKSAYYNPFVNSVAWLGTLFLRLLKMIIIPLILSSLISGITNIQSGENLGKIMLKTFGYYVTTSFLAIMTGLFMVNLLKPGKGM